MKLKVIEEALKLYEARGDHDYQTQVDIYNCWIELAEMKKPKGVDDWYCQDVTILPSILMNDLCNRLLYDTYGRMARRLPNGCDIVANFINAVHTEDCLTEISDLILADAFEYLRDLWNDNEAIGDNNADGSFKQPKDLTDEERTIIRNLICSYRDSLAGSNDEYFDQMQAILEKLR